MGSPLRPAGGEGVMRETPSAPPTPRANGADHAGMTDEDRQFLEGIAGWLAERRLAAAALLFLESVKPLNFVGSQFMFFFEPVVKAFLPGAGYSRFASLMEDRSRVEEFLRMIERADASQQDRKKEVEHGCSADAEA